MIGSGPNGLTAAVMLARAGYPVRVVECKDTPGGGCRSAELTLPGYTHDICAAVHPMGVLSPVFSELNLAQFGLQWAPSKVPLAHPLPDGSGAVLDRSIDRTCEGLGDDGQAWRQLLGPFSSERFVQSLLGPVWYLRGAPLLKKARFGLSGLQSCDRVARKSFKTESARALFAGCAAHSVLPLTAAGTASFGLVLAAVAHAVDWPCATGGSGQIIAALVRALQSHGGKLELNHRVIDVAEFESARAVLFDLSPHQIVRIAGDKLPRAYSDRLRRFVHGPGIFKVDWALSAPIPWKNAACREATTVHVCGDYGDVLRSEHQVAQGRDPDAPFVLVAQQSLRDRTRAPSGRHTGWAYCHVPARCTVDMTRRIEAQIERLAPGFHDCILARHTISPAQLEQHNPTMIGGDIGGGANHLSQFLLRPVPRWNPYSTPNRRFFLCSSSTPPGGGVHGMCGYHAAQAVIAAGL